MNAIKKIKDMVDALQTCDPNGTLTLSLDGAVIYGDEQPGEVEYGFVPIIDFLHSKTHGERSDRVYLSMAPDDIERIVANRRIQSDLTAKISTPPVVPCTVTGAPVKVAVAISEETYMNLLIVVEQCNRVVVNNDGATTHGKLDISRMLSMLAEDAAMTNSRPGSWEGANLQHVLDSHGYG